MGEKLMRMDRRIYVSTYPSMLNIIRDENQYVSPYFFDFIFIDESHRSIYNTYGEILDYFKTMTLGMTATPMDMIDHNTFSLFDCEDGLKLNIQTLAKTVTDAHPHITEDLLKKVYHHPKAGFIQSIRHILGVEPLASFPQTVANAFDPFITAHTDLNSRQLEFLRLLKEFILEREKVEKKDLIQSPFTVIHPQGIRGVFSPAVINEILALTEELAA